MTRNCHDYIGKILCNSENVYRKLQNILYKSKSYLNMQLFAILINRNIQRRLSLSIILNALYT